MNNLTNRINEWLSLNSVLLIILTGNIAFFLSWYSILNKNEKGSVFHEIAYDSRTLLPLLLEDVGKKDSFAQGKLISKLKMANDSVLKNYLRTHFRFGFNSDSFSRYTSYLKRPVYHPASLYTTGYFGLWKFNERFHHFTGKEIFKK